uniref:Potassium channel domain-containing protein n=1 Tax=Brassica oleracea TaxID=3712 RepID=A0A3P6GGL4_BRAOL|nr:unnamed protein product [Brassica oleracea]
MAIINDLHHPIHQQTDLEPSSRSVVRQAFALLVVYLSLGVFIYWLNRDHYVVNQTHPVVDGLYFCIVTMCTIGYGDITPNSVVTKLFSIMFVLVGFGFIDVLLSGMVSYVLDLQESYMLDSAKRREEPDKRRSYIIDVKKGRMRIRLKVGLALGVVVFCIALGVGIMHFIEKIDWLDSFYLSVMSVTTVGYGDRAFMTLPGRLFAAVWLLVSTLAVARAFFYLAEARVDKRNRERAKRVLCETMSVSQFFAADIDNNGCVRERERERERESSPELVAGATVCRDHVQLATTDKRPRPSSRSSRRDEAVDTKHASNGARKKPHAPPEDSHRLTREIHAPPGPPSSAAAPPPDHHPPPQLRRRTTILHRSSARRRRPTFR